MTDTFPFLKSQEADAPKKAIMIVEDDPSNAEALALLLQLEGGYETYCFHQTHEILDHLDEVLSLNPLLFVLDYRLPHMSGFDLYHRLQSTEGLRQVPAIILTARSISEAERALMADHHLIFVPKPYSSDDLLALIQQTIL